VDFVSSIAVKNVFACQFHPEKSHKVGLKVLKNFKELDLEKDFK
jgi:glutamine amidotransferase